MDAFDLFYLVLQLIQILVWGLVTFISVKLILFLNLSILKKFSKLKIQTITCSIFLIAYMLTYHYPHHIQYDIESVFVEKKNHEDGEVSYVFEKYKFLDNLNPGVYRWKDDKPIFIRELTQEEINTKSINEELTK